jgi:hypothetical protein
MNKREKPANNITRPEFFKVLKKVARKTKPSSQHGQLKPKT